MRLAVFSAKSYDREYLSSSFTPHQVQVSFHSFALSSDTVSLTTDTDAVCVFVNDVLDRSILAALSANGVKAILLRCAGFNNVDLLAAEELGFFVANVPAYSPEAVAEFAVSLIQTLNRQTHRAFNRVREGNFNLEGLLGYTLHGKTVGIVGVGRIGLAFAKIMAGFGCHLLAYDSFASKDDTNSNNPFTTTLGGRFVTLDELLQNSDVVSLHCPLTEETRHLINENTLGRLKRGALLVNTSRGGLVKTSAAIAALKGKTLGGLALDVYEAEGDLFYNDYSGEIIHDDELMRLVTFPNVLVCGHQAFFTHEALQEIAGVTTSNLLDFMQGRSCRNSLVREGHVLVKRNTEPVRI
ncbi:hypothetical protein ASPZODRAFT_133690 [Penicilliopsis zonata CBS 506.65]|uniref:S-adenosyl-L-homocysteine hydrolase NAD binding domain-containing protein n=1 Tax=Penicilliopsis zonata CBS 506.65 TaxID=1073090 RepID=A0A1L9SF78_9EURO|nr:hypothetical protein ASPZODRAFT_133690 [Penicilliopsis zonata CBS 506.65]OJJ45829.1 hypothetical protein ASPZODRAFT_133690 [Penicilliopsis zonata CBS 506.65]